MTMRSTTPTGEWINRATAEMSKARTGIASTIRLAAIGLDNPEDCDGMLLKMVIEKLAAIEVALKLAEAPF